MKPGDVLRWENCPFFNEVEQKTRWLVCIGTYSMLGKVQEIFISTTTTKVAEYQPGNPRAKHLFFRINRKKYAFFTHDCLIDLSLNPIESVYPETIETNKAKWQIAGEIDKNDIKEIFNLLVRAESVPPKILTILRTSLENLGIAGLARVK